MTIPVEARDRLEDYLLSVRRRLRGFSPAEIDDVVAELRSHVLDKPDAEGAVSLASVEAALASLGPPHQLAAQYLTEAALSRTAAAGRSPFAILSGLLRWAALSVVGSLVLLTSLVGYLLGICFFLVALLKPLNPHTAGLWQIADDGGSVFSIRLGFGGVAPGRELLGWWIIPIGLLIGYGLIVLTTRLAQWSVKAYRKSRALPNRAT